MAAERIRRSVFGEAVEQYEAARPGYPAQLVDDVLDYARLDGAPALEVGAGTGKASVAFAARGPALTCVEPDPRMAEVLRHHLADRPAATVEVAGFEGWRPTARFGLLFAAQSWHWIDAVRQWDLAVGALRPGGAVALFWNRFNVADPALRLDLHAVHQGLEPASFFLVREPDDLEDEEAGVRAADADWPGSAMAEDGRFTDLELRRYRTEHHYTADRLIDLMASISGYRMLPEADRLAVFADVRRVVAAHGGLTTLTTPTHLYLARTRTDSGQV